MANHSHFSQDNRDRKFSTFRETMIHKKLLKPVTLSVNVVGEKGGGAKGQRFALTHAGVTLSAVVGGN